MTNVDPNVIWCTHHPDTAVSLVCLQYQCVKNALMCQSCIEERHDGHPYISLTKMKSTMMKFKCKRRELNKDNLDKARKIKVLFQEAFDQFQHIYVKMKRLSEFMESVEQNLLFNSDELNVMKEVLSQLSGESGDTEQIHRRFTIFFKSFKVSGHNQNEIALDSYQDQKNNFSGSLRGQVDIVFREFESFLGRMQQLEKKYRQFTKPKNEVTEEQRNIEFGKQQLTPFYLNQSKQQQSQPKPQLPLLKQSTKLFEDDQFSSFQQDNRMNNNSTNVSSSNNNQQGPRKLVFKLYSYLIFYLALECDAYVPEPVLGGVVLKKVESGELKMPIRCVFCKQVKIKSFVEFYFRFELTTRFGKLCLYRIRDMNDNPVDIYAHEMCLLWSNPVVVDHNTRQVDVPSITEAALTASRQVCNYCQLTGASTKCSEESCDISFHFNCLKQMKLVGIKLDPDVRYRYHCDTHSHLHKAAEKADWFMSRMQVQNILDAVQEQRKVRDVSEDNESRKKVKY